MKFDKNKIKKFYTDNFLLKTQEMFKYRGLPKEINQSILEKFLQKEGKLLFFKHNDKYYCLNGSYTGEQNAYYEYDNFIITNPHIPLNKTFKIDVDAIIIKNDSFGMGLLPLIKNSTDVLSEIHITHILNVIDMRKKNIIVAKDKKSQLSAEAYLNKIENGENTIISNSKFFDDDIKVLNENNRNSITQELIELTQYVRANLFNEIGLNSNFNLKRERLNSNEISANEDVLYPLVDNMLKCRKEALEKINKMFGLKISVQLNSSWLKKDTGGILYDRKGFTGNDSFSKNSNYNLQHSKITEK